MSLIFFPLAMGAMLVGMAVWGLGSLAGVVLTVAGAICLLYDAWEG